jgi:hypothetical protein
MRIWLIGLVLACASCVPAVDARATCEAGALAASKAWADRVCPPAEGRSWEECPDAPAIEAALILALEACDHAAVD